MIYQCTRCGDLVSDVATPNGGYCRTTFDQHVWSPVGLEGALAAIVLGLKGIHERLEELDRSIDKLEYRTREEGE